MPAILCATFLLSVSGLRFWLPLRLRALIFSRRTLGAASWHSQLANQNGYGLRVPSLVISPYAKHGYIDHQILSSDAYLKFIEDDFLGGARLNPATDGRPDPRPDVREDEAILGHLEQDFDFNQAPRAPVLLAANPPTDSPSIPAYFRGRPPCVGCTTPPPGGPKVTRKSPAGT